MLPSSGPRSVQQHVNALKTTWMQELLIVGLVGVSLFSGTVSQACSALVKISLM